MTKKELKKARDRLTAYTIAKDMDVGLCEVYNFKILREKKKVERNFHIAKGLQRSEGPDPFEK